MPEHISTKIVNILENDNDQVIIEIENGIRIKLQKPYQYKKGVIQTIVNHRVKTFQVNDPIKLEYTMDQKMNFFCSIVG